MGKDGGGQDEEGEGGGLESRDHKKGGDQEGSVLAPVVTGISSNVKWDFFKCEIEFVPM